jgi:hypothetical protein
VPGNSIRCALNSECLLCATALAALIYIGSLAIDFLQMSPRVMDDLTGIIVVMTAPALWAALMIVRATQQLGLRRGIHCFVFGIMVGSLIVWSKPAAFMYLATY